MIQSCPHLTSVNEFLIYPIIAHTVIVSFLHASPTYNRACIKSGVDTSCLVPLSMLLCYRRPALESLIYYLWHT